MNSVVADTGPLLHLKEVGCFAILSYLGVVQVTPTVWREFLTHAPDIEPDPSTHGIHFVQPSPQSLVTAENWTHAGVLDAGEAEALAYAVETKADLFITDDAAARTIGESLGLNVRGTLGVVLYAAANRCIDRDKAGRILSDLEARSTLWMSQNVKRAARRALEVIFEVPDDQEGHR